MTKFLISDANPDGLKLEDILIAIRKDILYRVSQIADDTRPEAKKVMENNVEILALITESINLAEASTQILRKSFGPSTEDERRIGD